MYKFYPINEQIYISKLYSIFTAYRSNGYYYKGESHDFWECVCVLDGEICVSADERVYNMKKGEMIFHKPLEFHKYHVENENHANLFIFSFSATGSIIDYFIDKVFRLSDTHLKIIDNFLEYIYTKFPERNKMEQHYVKAFSSDIEYSQMVVTYIYQLLLTLYNNSKSSAASKSYDATVFRTAVEYMSKNISDSLSLSDIAKECNISITGLKNIFSKYAGVGVHKYFLTMKINKAVHLLSEGTNVTVVSDMLGFSNQAYFSAAFKRETGISPAKYKK